VLSLDLPKARNSTFHIQYRFRSLKPDERCVPSFSITVSMRPDNTCLATLSVKPLAVWKGTCDGCAVWLIHWDFSLSGYCSDEWRRNARQETAAGHIVAGRF
jgi:hypothetical protein